MNADNRPKPEDLLARAHQEDAHHPRGALKIFFGAAAGVGKTFSMLDAGRIRKSEGVDVVVGYAEPHGRKDTEALLNGLEVLPYRYVDYKGVRLREFDLDAALRRQPKLILVDELAHTNAPGSRHAKRWQDIEELLAAGIDVYTTVNVQHLESQNDIVAQITGEIQRETVPDAVFEAASEVELIDLPVEELLKRLRDGKVYRPQQAELAAGRFFRTGNLTALREIALRRTAERVDAQMQAYQRERSIQQVWPAAERILVCIGPSLLSQKLVRAAKRMAAGLRADWVVVYVEMPEDLRLNAAKQDAVTQALRLAEELGAQTKTLTGDDIVAEVLAYARQRNISKIVVGKPEKPRWRELVSGSMVNRLVRESGQIDIYVIHGDHDDTEPRSAIDYLRPSAHAPASAYVWSVLVVLASTIIAEGFSWVFPRSDLANLIMFYLLGTVVVAIRFGRWPSVVASVLSVALFDFLFVAPQYTFAVEDSRYVFTFAIMLVTGLVISNLTARIRLQVIAARDREHRTQELYDMSREFVRLRDLDELARSAVSHIGSVFNSTVALLLPGEGEQLRVVEAQFDMDEREMGVARWVFDHAEPAGLGTNTLASSAGLYLPLQTTRGTMGVLGVRPSVPERFTNPEQFNSLAAFANQTALAVERAALAIEAGNARVQMETEQLRSSLLSSVSHDLRTPLAAITGSASTLLDAEAFLTDETRRELTQSIYGEAERLNRLVNNLLDMTRLESNAQSNAMAANKEWESIEEVVGSALARLEKSLHGRDVDTHVPGDLPMAPFDAVMIEQVLINLLENALKYTPPGAPISISAWRADADGSRSPGESGGVMIEVADRGPGLKSGDETRVFDKFYRGTQADTSGAAPSGAGLGLAICKAIVNAHGGRIWAANRDGGGASFRFWLPIDQPQPDSHIEAPRG